MTPIAYYHPETAIGQVFAASGSGFGRMAVIGLGTGALACYARSGQQMMFLEIDPAVKRVAEDPGLFTYLQHSAGAVDVRIGDGRKLLEGLEPASYDLIIVDAFSSDSVPVHMVTVEALRAYLSRLRPDGLIAFHISNRHLDLESVLGAIAGAEGLFTAANRDHQIPDAQKHVRMPSHWVVLSRNRGAVDAIGTRPGWRSLEAARGARPWTDDYSNILDALFVR